MTSTNDFQSHQSNKPNQSIRSSSLNIYSISTIIIHFFQSSFLVCQLRLCSLELSDSLVHLIIHIVVCLLECWVFIQLAFEWTSTDKVNAYDEKEENTDVLSSYLRWAWSSTNTDPRLIENPWWQSPYLLAMINPSNEADARKAVVRLSDDSVECTFTGSRNGKVGEPIHLECPCATVTFLRKLLFEMLADMKQIWHREYMYKYFYE